VAKKEKYWADCKLSGQILYRYKWGKIPCIFLWRITWSKTSRSYRYRYFNRC